LFELLKCDAHWRQCANGRAGSKEEKGTAQNLERLDPSLVGELVNDDDRHRCYRGCSNCLNWVKNEE